MGKREGIVVISSHLEGEGHYQSNLYRVEPVLCRSDIDYWAGIAKFWESDLTIINIEHDVETTDAHIDSLISCPHPLDAFAYKCHWVSSGQANGVYAATINGRFVEPGDEWAEWSALGLIKITPGARIGPLREVTWNRVENSIDEAVKTPWHMHWVENNDGTFGGVPHHHW